MQRDDFTVIYSGASFQADLLKSLLEGKGIRAILEDEFLGRMVPYAVLSWPCRCFNLHPNGFENAPTTLLELKNRITNITLSTSMEWQ